MLFHDDVVNALWMRGYSTITIFAPYTFGGAWARPLANALWLFVRDRFSYFDPAAIHSLNVIFHVISTMLVGAMIARITRQIVPVIQLGDVGSGRVGYKWPSTVYITAAIAALLFGLYPFSFQTVLWAGAIYHPVMVAFGLLALWLSLTPTPNATTRVISLLALLFSALSHDVGFQFAVVVVWVHMALAWIKRRRLNSFTMIQALVVIALALLYRVLLQRQTGDIHNVTLQPIASVFKNLIVFMQGWVYILVIPLRQWLGLTDDAPQLIVALFVISVLLGLWALHRARIAAMGVILLGIWLILSVPNLLLLDEAYVRFGPRLLYSSTIAVVGYWALLLAMLMQLRWLWRGLVLMGVLVLSIWCIRYIDMRLRETERLTPGLRMLSDQVSHSFQGTDIVLINMPWWNAPSNPSFWVGAEGMPLFQHLGAPAWTWVGMQTRQLGPETVAYGVERETSYVSHIPSRGQFTDWVYGTPGDELDDAALRARLFADLQTERYINRFVYDPPGVRMQRLAQMRRSALGWVTQYTYKDEENALYAGAANVYRCGDVVQLGLDWRISETLKSDLAVFVHGVNTAGEQVLVADADPVGGYLPLNHWPAPLSIFEIREIRVPSDVHDLRAIQIGIYRRDNGQHLVVTRADGTRVDGYAMQITLPETTDVCQP